MTKYTEREVRDLANLMKHGDDDEIVAGEMLTQLADMLVEREKAQPVYQFRLSHGDEWYDISKKEFEEGTTRPRELRVLFTHPAAQPRAADGYTDEQVERAVRAHDIEDAAQKGEPDPWTDDFPEPYKSERMTAMRLAPLAAQESGR